MLYQVGWIGESADRVKFVESMQTSRAGQTIPVVAATLPPAVYPGLANIGMRKRTEVARFAMYAMLITAQKCSFHRITLESSHWVLPQWLTGVPVASWRDLADRLPMKRAAGVAHFADTIAMPA